MAKLKEIYIQNTFEDITQRVFSAAPRVIVSMPTGMGHSLVTKKVIEALFQEKIGDIVFATPFRLMKDQMENMLKEAKLENITCLTTKALLSGDISNTSILILDNYNKKSDRKQMYEHLKEYEGTVITFDMPFLEIRGNNSESGTESLKPGKTEVFGLSTIVVSAQTLLSLNDWEMANLREQQMIRVQLNKQKDILRQSIEELEQEEIRSAEIRKQRLIEDLLCSIGISSDLIDSANRSIENLRSEMADDLESEDDETRERAFSILQEKIVETVSNLTKDIIRIEDKEECETQLINYISDDVWNKLLDESKNYLSTARITFNNMVAMDNQNNLDYSGVCLLITKAVDVEVFRRFFKPYRDYLRKKYKNDYSKWPKEMLNEKKTKALKENKVTLGSIIHIMGLRKDGKSIVINRKKDFDEFVSFATEILFDDMPKEKIEKVLLQDVEYIETAREEYRNKTAHRNEMNQEKAQACNEYVIERIKILRKIIEPMCF